MLFRFLMIGVLAATATELAEFKPVGRGLLIFGRNVVSTLTVVTLKHNIIAWHNSNPGLCTLFFVLCVSLGTHPVIVRLDWALVPPRHDGGQVRYPNGCLLSSNFKLQSTKYKVQSSKFKVQSPKSKVQRPKTKNPLSK